MLLCGASSSPVTWSSTGASVVEVVVVCPRRPLPILTLGPGLKGFTEPPVWILLVLTVVLLLSTGSSDFSSASIGA